MSKKYTKEYKLDAIALSQELGSIAEATRQLGLNKNHIYNWKNQYRSDLATRSPVKAKPTSESEEILRLKKENEELKKVNYILKRASAFFAQDHLK